MDIKNVETFVKVAELESFTRASEALSYVQSTVTMQIKQLEKELGFPLFDRIGKKISLTDSGREFLDVSYELLHSVEKAESIGKNKKELHGTLRIGVSESLLFTVIAEILPDFKEKFRNIEVKIITGHSVELVEQLKTNQLDMLYIAQPQINYSDLVCLYTRPEHFIFVCAPTHNAAKRKLTATELKILELLMTNAGKIFSAEEIYSKVWNEDAYAVENTVMVHIRHIREKIEINPREPKYLKVVYGLGYKIEKL